ncbi:hypothetical protein C1645_96878 [Glomus cerebriforme]|uniref:Uncharacterized protein n=1 Tax=Glomus cerebriforme TaxID=658196 RepID=A0A397TTV7_9GLOM|nr:hypothetical protein C1645_96878 [Glomus cerebriforme]
MSLDEKKQLLMEVRKKKSMLRSSILRNKQAQNVGEDNKNRLRMNSSKLLSPQKKAPNKLNNTALTRLTKQNTDKNKEYRCELNVVVVRKNVPKPLSPTSKLHEKTKNGGITSALRSHNNKGKDNMGSYIPVLKSRSGRQNLTNQNESSNKGVHWNESRLIQESSPLIKSSPRTARQKPIPKSCLKQTVCMPYRYLN